MIRSSVSVKKMTRERDLFVMCGCCKVVVFVLVLSVAERRPRSRAQLIDNADKPRCGVELALRRGTRTRDILSNSRCACLYFE
jgi:hypothetical protein